MMEEDYGLEQQRNREQLIERYHVSIKICFFVQEQSRTTDEHQLFAAAEAVAIYQVVGKTFREITCNYLFRLDWLEFFCAYPHDANRL
jgi:hypothetical protein